MLSLIHIFDAYCLRRAAQNARQYCSISTLSGTDARERLHSGQVVSKVSPRAFVPSHKHRSTRKPALPVHLSAHRLATSRWTSGSGSGRLSEFRNSLEQARRGSLSLVQAFL